jgi:hypothetical protein
VTFYRTSEQEAGTTPGLVLASQLAGVPLYVHESLVGHFATHPLLLTVRGPRLAIEKDQALMELEAALLVELEGDPDER